MLKSRSPVLTVDPFYEDMNFLMEKKLSQRTFKEVTKIFDIMYKEGITKERLKPLCITYLSTADALYKDKTQQPKEKILSMPMTTFADLFLPLLEKRKTDGTLATFAEKTQKNGSLSFFYEESTLELCDNLDPKIKKFYNDYVSEDDVYSTSL